ncbi:MAG: hypothetical protein PHO74_05020 [Weeksellaceae bacterium]|nr:hypothetical protein [Weeksellaceae bacterium]
MAKKNERLLAKELFVNQGLTAKAIAQKGLAAEKTIGVWVKKYGWKKLRDAKQNSTDNRAERIGQVIETLTEQRLELFTAIAEAKKAKDNEQLAQLQKEAVGIDDAISKWNKALENLNKDNRISLSVYLEVMEDIFRNLQAYDTGLHLKTLDFQEEHLNTISMKL